MPRGTRSLPVDQPQTEIEENNPATGGRPDDPVPEAKNSRAVAANARRAVTRATGAMSVSKKTDPDTRVAGQRATAAKSDGSKTSAGAKPVERGLDKGSVKTGGVSPQDEIPTKVTRSNAEIAEGLTTTARKSPAPRSVRTASTAATETGAAHVPAKRQTKTGGARQRLPAPGNVVSETKPQTLRGKAKTSGERSTSSEGTAKPAKKSARGGRSAGASRSKGADQGHAS